MKTSFLLLALLSALMWTACDNSSNPSDDPNVIGGETNLDITKVGTIYLGSFNASELTGGKISHIDNKAEITKNENGIITAEYHMTFDIEDIKVIDTLFGLQDMAVTDKIALATTYFEPFNIKLDIADTHNIKIDFEAKAKVTNEGIQDFRYSGGNTSKPFTIVKYNSNVGDKYSFTTDKGEKITREVIYKSTDDDFEWGFWNIKVIKVKEKALATDPIVDEIEYITNHKFGLVGVNVSLKTGKIIELILI